MQLLDRYLTAVKYWLPKKQRDDIAAELEANLRGEMDDLATELGRPLTDDEIAVLLKKNGSPILAASRYQQEHRTVTFGRQLIGPLVFPFYWTALKVTLVLLLIPGVVPAVVLGSRPGQPFAELGNALVRMARLSLPALLLVTLLFALIDFVLRKFHFLEVWSGDWDPLKLPPSARQAKQVRRSSSIAGIIIQSLFILWWWNHGSIPYLVVTNAGAHVHFAPVLAMLYVPVLVIAFISLAQHLLNLVEPDWRWLPPATGLVTSVIALIILYPLLGTSPLISISQPNGLPLSAREAAQIQNVLALSVTWLWFGIMIAGAVYAWRLVWIAYRSLPKTPGAPRTNGVAHT